MWWCDFRGEAIKYSRKAAPERSPYDTIHLFSSIDGCVFFPAHTLLGLPKPFRPTDGVKSAENNKQLVVAKFMVLSVVVNSFKLKCVWTLCEDVSDAYRRLVDEPFG